MPNPINTKDPKVIAGIHAGVRKDTEEMMEILIAGIPESQARRSNQREKRKRTKSVATGTDDGGPSEARRSEVDSGSSPLVPFGPFDGSTRPGQLEPVAATSEPLGSSAASMQSGQLGASGASTEPGQVKASEALPNTTLPRSVSSGPSSTAPRLFPPGIFLSNGAIGAAEEYPDMLKIALDSLLAVAEDAGLLVSPRNASAHGTNDEPPPAKRIRPAPTLVVPASEPAPMNLSGEEIIMIMAAIASDPELLASARVKIPILPWSFVERPTPTTGEDPMSAIPTSTIPTVANSTSPIPAFPIDPSTILTSSIPTSTIPTSQGSSLVAVGQMTTPITLGNQGSSSMPPVSAPPSTSSRVLGGPSLPNPMAMVAGHGMPSQQNQGPHTLPIGQAPQGPLGPRRNRTPAHQARINWPRIFTPNGLVIPPSPYDRFPGLRPEHNVLEQYSLLLYLVKREAERRFGHKEDGSPELLNEALRYQRNSSVYRERKLQPFPTLFQVLRLDDTRPIVPQPVSIHPTKPEDLYCAYLKEEKNIDGSDAMKLWMNLETAREAEYHEWMKLAFKVDKEQLRQLVKGFVCEENES